MERLPPPHPHSHSHSHLPSNSTFPASNPPDSSNHDLYTIPSHSCWFSWDSIHETERSELREFFDGSSFTRTPKIYKEYRDFIISKFREDPSRKLRFTHIRKSLVGDVCILRKVFNFLDKWGLINFGAEPENKGEEEEEEDDGVRVRVEEGPPVGVRVVVAPNLSKVLSSVACSGDAAAGGGGVEGGFKLPPLASYSDVFEGSREDKGVVCGNCKEKCENKYYECTKDKYVICLKCFEKGTYGEIKSIDDFKLNDSSDGSGNQGTIWTEAETLLLLESVLKHGDDWELVAQNVKTKSRYECISRLIELPFGQLILGPQHKSSKEVIDESNVVQEPKTSSEALETNKMTDDSHQENVGKDNKMADNDHQVNVEKDNMMEDDNHKVNVENGSKMGDDNHKVNIEKNKMVDKNHQMNAEKDNKVEDDNHLENVVKDSKMEDDNQQVNVEKMEGDNHRDNVEKEDKMEADNHQEHIEDSQLIIPENVDKDKLENDSHQENVEEDNFEKIESMEPPPKKHRVDTSDPSRSLMEQVALISSMVGPQITATAASAAVSVLSDGNPLVRDIFYSEDHSSADERRPGNLDMELEKAIQSEDSEMKDASLSSAVVNLSRSRNSIPLALRMRAAVATALGTTAAHARLLADQEEREIEHLMAFIIETQMKKLERKAKFFKDLEQLMEKEHVLLDEVKDSVIDERMDTLQKIFAAGICRWKDHTSLKLPQ